MLSPLSKTDRSGAPTHFLYDEGVGGEGGGVNPPLHPSWGVAASPCPPPPPPPHEDGDVSVKLLTPVRLFTRQLKLVTVEPAERGNVSSPAKVWLGN